MSLKKQKKILLIPSIKKGNGSGHIQRIVKLGMELIEDDAQVSILIDTAAYRMHECYTLEDVRHFLPAGRKKKPTLLSETLASDWDLCVFDTREIPVSRLSAFSGLTITVGLDEGGGGRAYFDYLIDILPNLEEIEPNICSPGFLQLPEQPASFIRKDKFEKILISFGGEDPADLTGKFFDMVDDTGIFDFKNITIVKGPFFRERDFPDDIKVLESPNNLGSMLKDWDLVVTSFGLTCFEALFSGTPVILFNPSVYHQNLSVRAGIPEIGINKPDRHQLESLVDNKERLYRAVDIYSGISRLNLADFILDLEADQQKCRGCGRKHHKIIYRSSEHSFFKCSNCGLVNQMYFGSEQMEYGEEYFFEDYKKQYGKTYLEDFEHIKSVGLSRCDMIRKIVKGNVLLDIGCGYGPFLAAAEQSDFKAYGIDVSQSAAAWVKSELDIPAMAVSVEDFHPEDLGVENFDAVTMWFVIEHLNELPAVLAKINSMLPLNGIFAFSTPNYNGASRRRSQTAFLKASPLDHFTIWSPESAKKLLAKYGFRVKAVKCPVIHPDRFFPKGFYERLPNLLRTILMPLLTAMGCFFKLGDTFEVYAVKKNNIGEII